MHKFILLFLLITGNYITAEPGNYYAFMMHLTHMPEYNQEVWQKNVPLIEALTQQCNDTQEDKSAAAFNLSQKNAIKTIQNICALNKGEKTIHITMQVLREPVFIPADGIIINFEYKPVTTDSSENNSKIDDLMTELEIYSKHENKNELLANLNKLELVFEHLSGEASLGVSFYKHEY